MVWKLCLLSFAGLISSTEAFYMGMFHKNDYMVAHDFLYRERRPYQRTMAKYGRVFKCPITYLNVIDRLGIGKGPIVEIVRGGLQEHYIVLRLMSPIDTPISVHVYVGCHNPNGKKTTTTTTTTTASITPVEGIGDVTVATSEMNTSTDTPDILTTDI